MASPSKIEVRALAQGESAEILLYGVIGESDSEESISAKQFREQLKALGSVKTLHVRIDSGGGNFVHGVAIYQALIEHSAYRIVHVDAFAGSMASVVAMSGDEIWVAEAGLLMIHNPWGGAEGSADDLRRYADMMDKTTATMAAIYAKRTGLSVEEVTSMMAAETWFTAQEAVQKGFATKISGKAETFARMNLQGYRNVPGWVRELCAGPPATKPKETPKMSDTKPTEPQAATLAQLKAHCEGADSGFLVAQLEANATVEVAMKAWSTKLKADLEALQKEAAELKASAASSDPGKKPGVKALADKPSNTASSGDVKTEVETLVAEASKLHGEPRHKAYARVMASHPDLREKLIASTNTP